MMRSMYSGISGLRVHQTKMDVIGNNIANVNTTGFKAGRVTFNEIFSQTLQGASGASDTTGRGGRNPMQVGLGVNVASIDTLMTEGAAQRTDNPLDLKIEGEGFFIVGDASGNKFTRDGAFRLDNQGNLINASGLKLKGWAVDTEDSTAIKRGPVQELNLSGNVGSVAPEKTTAIRLEGNLYTKDADEAGESISTNMNFYDSQGNRYSMQMDMVYNDNTFEWTALPNVQVVEGANPDDNRYFIPMSYNGENYYAELNGDDFADYESAVDAYNTAVTNYLADPSDPALKTTMETAATTMNTEWATAVSTELKLVDTDGTTETGSIQSFTFGFDGNGEIESGTTTLFENNNQPITQMTLYRADENGDVILSDTSKIPAEIGPLEVDYSNLTQYASATTAQAYRGDIDGAGAGREAGNLTGISIGSDGKISGRYSNGETKLLGQIAIARFKNPAGLQKVGNNLFDVTPNSGDFDGIGEDPTAGGGSLNAGVLEMSNVDLAKEFTEMITTQRGFQASSRIITSSDEMLQELVNLKR